VARREWLGERLHIDWARLPRDPCERFAEWQRRLDPGSVTLIYASYYFNNPSSMFGHTLLRLDKRGRAEDQRLLDYTVAYGAVIPPDTGGLLWAIKGVFGAYEGYFSLLPYYAKVREYNDFEDRDLWEYRLALSDEEVAQLLRHAWEMGSTYYDYYFFRENCSYQLLALIEAARPELRLRERFSLYTLPTSTLRAVLEQPGLVESVTFRASRGTQIHWKLDQLSAPARDLVFDLAADARPVESPAFAALEVEQKALVLEAAADIHQRELAGDGQNDPRRQELRRLLLARAKLGYRRTEEPNQPAPKPPEEGHGSSRLFLGGGGNNSERGFYEAGFDTSFHELLAKEDGYAPNSQILGLSFHVRYEPEPADGAGGRVVVERADLVNIISLFPVSRLSRQFSWRVRAGWERSRDLGCAACAPFILDGGIGFAAETHVLTRETYFAFLEPALQVDGLLPDGYRFGLGGTLGLLFEFTPDWRVALTGSQTRYVLGVDEPVTVERAALRQRYSLSQNLDLRLDWSGVEHYREVMAGVSWYF